MTSAQQCRGDAPARGRRCGVAAVLLAALCGCSPLQKNWSQRFGAFPLEPIPSRAAPPVLPRVSTDPYADRLALNDRPADPAWVAVPEPPEGPPSGAAAAASPASSATLLASRSAPADRATGLRPAPVEPDPAPFARSTATEPEPPVDPLEAIDRLMDRGIARLDGYRNYRVTLDRQERVREALQPSERVTLSVRTEPFAVRLEWPDGPNRGREVLYSEAECNGMMHVKLPKTLIPVPPMQLDPNSPLALANSRHPITEAGLRDILTQTKEKTALVRSGDPDVGVFELREAVDPPEGNGPCLEIVRIATNGEFWRLVIDQETSLPVLLEATDGRGQLLERYHFRNVETDLAELDGPDAFDPVARFGKPLALPVDRLATSRPE